MWDHSVHLMENFFYCGHKCDEDDDDNGGGE